MPSPHLPSEVIETVSTAGSALGPAAIGAAVSQAFKRGLTYSERLIQMTVGICVSYFVGGALNAIFQPSPFVAQAISFVFAMVAYEATPGFISNAAQALAGLPWAIRDRVLDKAADVAAGGVKAAANDNELDPSSSRSEIR